MTKPLRVLQVLPELNLGGVERGTLEVGKALVERGHKSFVVSAGGRLVNQLEQGGTHHFNLPVGKKSLLSLRYVKPLRKLIVDNNIDIVHVRSRFPAWITKFALAGIDKTQQPKLISTVHGAYSVNAYSKIMLRADRIIAVSDFIKSYIVSNYSDTDENKLNVICRGVDEDDFSKGFKPSAQWLENWFNEFPRCKNRSVLCLPGRISRLKGHEDFLQIVKSLKQTDFNFHAIIVGGHDENKNNYYNFLQQCIKEYKLDDVVSFTGSRNDIKEILSSSDIVFNLSNKPESFGRTALEALSLGKPVIAYNHGGTKEILDKLFPAGLIEREGIDNAIEKIHSFSKTSININNNTFFTIKNMLDRTIDLYESFS